MTVLGIILARAGSKGLPDKCVRTLRGRPVIAYTFDHALGSVALDAILLTTDSEPAKTLARNVGIEVIDRPAELAGDRATVDAAARHAVETWEVRHHRRVDAVVLLYGNIPVRASGLIDRAIEKLRSTGADSVRSVAPVSKQHPDWIHRLDGDRMIQFRPNSIYRRQDLEPLYYHDGAVAAVTRDALFGALETPDDHQSFLGKDRRAAIQRCDEAVDIDEPIDLLLAESILAYQASTANEKPHENHNLHANANLPEPQALARATERTTHAGARTTGAGTPIPIPIQIGPHNVGTGRRTFVIAEAGVNHNGCVDTALRMVNVAAASGADAVKFQWFDASSLAIANAATATYQSTATKNTSQRDMLARLQLSRDDFARIKRHCDDCSIIFLATPFGVAQIAPLVELRVPAIKFASTDLVTESLIEAACATKLPLILSTGAATLEEIDRAVAFVTRCGARDRMILLHCVSCYPTPMESANLGAIAALHHRFGVPTGYSDHTTSTRTGALAVAAGACVLEKHFTLDPAAAGPDHAMSLNPDQLTEYVARVREAHAALGSGAPGMQLAERDVRHAARKSIVSATSISAGDVITIEKLTLKRPGTGLAACEIERLIGRRAAIDVPRDALITWDLIEP